MPYASRLYRFNITGKIGAAESIVHTVWMRADAGPQTPPDLEALTNKVANEWYNTVAGNTNMPPPLGPLLSNQLVYQKVSGYKVDINGHATEQWEVPVGIQVAGAAGSLLPPQVAVCVTLLTQRPGRSGRGRLFLGGFGTNAVETTTGRISAANRTIIANAMAGYYTRLRHQPLNTDVIRPVVVSPTLTDAFKITRVSVGDVFDTMRSRTNALTESKTQANVDV